MSVNEVRLVGFLGSDPELRYTMAGKPVGDLRVATSRRWKDGENKTHEDTQWHRVVVWGKQAENCKEYLAKGRQVFVSGRLQTRQWEDKTGAKRYTTEIVAERIEFLGGNPKKKEQMEDSPPPVMDEVPDQETEADLPTDPTNHRDLVF